MNDRKVSPRLLTLTGFYLLVAFIFAGELLWPGRSLYRWDTLLYTWPMVQEARAQLLSGHWPFWASSFCNGTPLLENINAGVFYPLKLLVYALPLRAGYQLFLFVHVWISFLFMHLFLQRGIGLRPVAAVVGALAFGGSGYARAMWDTHNFLSLPWVPLVLWCSVAAWSARRRMLALAAAFLMLVLGGDLEHAILSVPVALALAWLWPKSPEGRVVRTAQFAGGLLLGLALSAPQLLPAWDWSHHSYRAGGLPPAEAAERSFHPYRTIELVLPHHHGTRDSWRGSHLALGEKKAPWCSSFHIGLLPFLLALGALTFLRRLDSLSERRAAFWSLGLTVVALLLAIGGFLPPLFRLLHALPLIGSFRYPEKYLFWATLGLSVLSALGVQRLLPPLCAWAGSVVQREGGGRWFLRHPKLVFVIVTFLSVLLPWYQERPTTAAFDPLDRPEFLRPILASAAPNGRIFVDPKLAQVPLPPYFAGLRSSEREAVFLRERLEYNTPRLWGARTAGGFSPAESAGMYTLRRSETNDPVAAALALRARWLITSGPAWSNSPLVSAAPSRFPIEAAWGDQRQVVLVALPQYETAGDVSATVHPEGSAYASIVSGSLAFSTAQAGAVWHLPESAAPGWKRRDGRPLRVATNDVFLTVGLDQPASRLDLTYEPPLWRFSWWIALAGAIGLVGMCIRSRLELARLVKGRFCLFALTGTLFMVCSLLARSDWTCTFDEGFHLARGLALRHFDDARLSYFHPPLQNAFGGYWADLACGDRLTYPVTEALKRGDALTYATELARANPDVFNEAVRAARWGSLLFGLMLVVVGAGWAFQMGGPAAGWLAGFALALNPNLLAHTNLNTTDAGVTACAVAGTALLWEAFRAGSRLRLFLACGLFAVAGMVKFTGLIWLGATLVLVVPLIARKWQRPRLLWLVPASVVFFALLLFWFYGTPARYFAGLAAQADHAFTGHKAWFHGVRFEQSAWWHMPAAMVLKAPEAWIIGVVAAIGMSVRALVCRRFGASDIVPLLPALIFLILLLFVNNMAIGIRHALPLVALLAIAGAVAIVRLPLPSLRRGVVMLFLAGTALAGWRGMSDAIAYFPDLIGGPARGRAWLVDSNADWGQELDALAREWPRLTAENKGTPPSLLYYGFLDPAVSYGLRVGPHSYGGFMDAVRGLDNLRSRVRIEPGRYVVSVSARALAPHGLRLDELARGRHVGQVGNAYEVIDVP